MLTLKRKPCLCVCGVRSSKAWPPRGAALALILWHELVVLGGGIGLQLRVVLGWYWVVLGGIGTHWAHKGATCASPNQHAHAHRIQVFILNQTN